MPGLSDTVRGKIRGYFAREREGRMPGFLDPAHGTTQAFGGAAGGFGGDFGGGDSAYRDLGGFLRLDQDLVQRYRDYEEMDDYPECNAGLDIIADDAFQPDSQTGKSFEIESDDDQVKDRLTELHRRNLKMEEEGWSITRSLCKYGNNFEEHIVKEGAGIIGYNHLPTPSVRRMETQKHGLLGFVYDPKQAFRLNSETFRRKMDGDEEGGGFGGSSQVYEDWEVNHFRLRSKFRNSVYGFSTIDAARWVWRRLVMLEDAALIYKLTRAPARFAFFVDVGQMQQKQAESFVDRQRRKFKKHRFVNRDTGKLDFRLNPLGFQDDFWIPVFDGKRSSDVEVLSGPDFQSVEDIEYFRSKLFAAMKVPKIFLTFDENLAGRNALSAEDIRFARTVMRVQRAVRNGMRRSSDIHLIMLGIDPAAVDHDVHLTVPSAIFELAQIEVQNARADLASRMGEFVSRRYIMENIFGFNETEMEKIFAERREETLADAQTSAEAEKIIADLQAVAAAAAVAQQEGLARKLDSLAGRMKSMTEFRHERDVARKHVGEWDRYFTEEGRVGADRRADRKLNALLQSDRFTQRRLKESRLFMNELRSSIRSIKRAA